MDREQLAEYRAKRDFTRTEEPDHTPGTIRRAPHLRFVIQKHAASHLHYDLRLEVDGVFKSWAVPKGPSLDPDVPRSAFEVEDHPLEYGDFEGTIPQGQYGAGTVQIWDRGYWAPVGRHSPEEALRRGALDLVMEGERLHGEWLLRRAGRSEARDDRRRWVLIKRSGADTASRAGAVFSEDRSVASGRTMEEIAAGRGRGPKPFMLAERRRTAADATWRSHRKTRGSDASASASAPPASRARPRRPGRQAGSPAMPAFIEPQLALLVEAPPDRSGWAHEIKWDGYRIHVRVVSGSVTLLTRTGLDWTSRYPQIAQAAAALPVASAYLDGELCALRPDGRSSFDDIQAASEGRTRANLAYFAFDLLFLDGADLRERPLSERKGTLRRLLSPDRQPIRYGDHYIGHGAAFFERACKAQLEGIVSKRLDAPYKPGDRGLWRKTKCYCEEEFVVVGYTDPKGSRPHMGSILLAYHALDGRLVYAGRGGRGITERELGSLIKKFKRLVVPETPLDVLPPSTSRFGEPLNLARVHWMTPRLVCTVKFLAWTEDGQLREVIYVGLREDKPAREVRRPIPTRSGDVDASRRAPAARSNRARSVPTWNIMHRLPEAVVPSRDELRRYWRKVGKKALAYLARRPLTLVRHVHGVTFFHKRRLPPIPEAVHHLTFEKREGGDGVRVWVDDVAGLLALIDMDAVELHPWGAKVEDIEHPDVVVFDLDPGAAVDWEFVLDTGLRLRDLLTAEGYAPWVKTSGGKGLHVMVPLGDRSWSWDRARAWARRTAERLAGRDARYTTSSTANRDGRIFIDYLRNGRGSSAVGAYSPRARPGFPISMPISWEQVEAGIRADAYRLADVIRTDKHRAR